MSEMVEVLMKGDLRHLNDGDKVSYYNQVCDTVGLNPLTKPFEYIQLNGKEVLYATKGCAEQLRASRKISITIERRETIEGVHVVTARAATVDGRTDESVGAVPVKGLAGANLANAYMKAETKAKRRVTLSICGLNMLDETEVEAIKDVNPPKKELPEKTELATVAQAKSLFKVMKETSWHPDDAKKKMAEMFHVEQSNKLSGRQIEELAQYFRKHPNA